MTGSTYGSSAWSGQSDYEEGQTYASLDEVKPLIQASPTDLGLNDSEEDDDGLTEWDRWIQRHQRKAKTQIDSYTGRDFEPYSSQILHLDGGSGSNRVLTLPRPVREVHWVEVGDKRLSEDAYEVRHKSGSLIKTQGDATPRTSSYGSGLHSSMAGSREPAWSSGYNNITVLLDYGYLEPPADIKEAEAMLVDHAIIGAIQKRQSPVVQSDDFSIQANIPVALTDEIKEMLEGYGRLGVGN